MDLDWLHEDPPLPTIPADTDGASYSRGWDAALSYVRGRIDGDGLPVLASLRELCETGEYVGDGFGAFIPSRCPECGQRAMAFTRPGVAECHACGGEGVTDG